jgi:hypothetical protein
MVSFLYFAYGSNMLTTRLRARCPSAEPLGLAYAQGYRLAFSKPGRDGSVKGHLTPARRSRQPGVLFSIDLAERDALDRAEGLGVGYDRVDDFAVRRAGTAAVVRASTYLARQPAPALLPYDWYLALVIAGAREHGFDRRRIRALLATASLAHDDRPAHEAALLRAADCGDDLAAYFAALELRARPRRRSPRASGLSLL